MARSVTIAFDHARDVQANSTLACTATASTDMNKNVFVVRRVPEDATGENYSTVFERVATPADMSDLPTTQPFASGNIYRDYAIQQTFLLATDALEFKLGIIESVNRLITALNDADDAITETVVLSGTA
jgi:hypothetical protein